jgi:glutamine amidotransferase
MQLMATVGREDAETRGLGWIPGAVERITPTPPLPVPHMGWNDLQVKPNATLFSGFEPNSRLYFLHSYYFVCEDKAHVAATATYGLQFECAVSKGHIHGVQCHPEKSHHFGARVLKNFADL